MNHFDSVSLPYAGAFVGDIDIYLFDQLLRGRFDTRRRVLDAGCVAGRNLVHLLGRAFDAFAIDSDPAAVAAVKRLFARLAPQLAGEHVREGHVDGRAVDTATTSQVRSCDW